MLKKKEIRFLHLVARRIGLSDRAYQYLLATVCGVKSTEELDRIGFERMIIRMKEIAPPPPYDPDAPVTTNHRQQLARCLRLLGRSADGPYVRALLREVAGCDEIDSLSVDTAYRVILALKAQIASNAEAGKPRHRRWRR